LAAALFALSACGVLSSPERDETPSALMLRAQAAYDSGNYSEASSLFNRVVEKDPSNLAARARLSYAYLGSAGVSIIGIVKSKIPSSSGGNSSSGGSDNLNKLTENSGLPAQRISKLKSESANISTVEQLRDAISEFKTFQKAFESLCPAFPSSTLTKLNELSPAIKSVLNLERCGPGLATMNSDVTVAAIFLTLAQVSTLQPVFLATQADGKTFEIESKAKESSDKISTLSSSSSGATDLANLQTLNQSLDALRKVVSTLEGPIVKYTSAQISILSAVVNGSNLPSTVKTSIFDLENSLNSALSAVNKYSSSAQSGASGAGGASQDKVKESLTSAKSKAAEYFKTVTNQDEKEKTCKNIYCVALNQPDPASFLPAECQFKSYTCTQ
jgi:hypothetical protein